jgi:hypothetical protein
MNPKEDVFEGYKHMMVDVDDVEDENLLQHFKATNAFIEEGEKGGGGVLVHWYVFSVYTKTSIYMRDEMSKRSSLISLHAYISI